MASGSGFGYGWSWLGWIIVIFLFIWLFSILFKSHGGYDDYYYGWPGCGW